MAEDYSKKEALLQQRLEKLKVLEEELKEKEKAVKAKEKRLKEKDKAKKQMVLRLSPSLWNEIAAWAEEDFRSINGQVEYLLSECVRKRKRDKLYRKDLGALASEILFLIVHSFLYTYDAALNCGQPTAIGSPRTPALKLLQQSIIP